jgi:hypothetical protein
MIQDIGIIKIGVGKNNIDIPIKYINIVYMDKELELELVKKYPKILRDYGGDPMQTCLSWGFEFDNGWNTLISKCLEKLQYFCDLCSKNGEEVQVVANQAKEKHATLSFYTSVYGADSIESSIIDDIISEAEMRSACTCEVTGKDGTICKKGGWYKTLCYEEARKLGYKAYDESTEAYWKEKDAKGEKNDDSDEPETT